MSRSLSGEIDKKPQSAKKKPAEDNDLGDFEFFPSTKGLGSKIKGFDKTKSAQSSSQMKKANQNVNQLDQIFLCEIFKLN